MIDTLSMAADQVAARKGGKKKYHFPDKDSSVSFSVILRSIGIERIGPPNAILDSHVNHSTPDSTTTSPCAPMTRLSLLCEALNR